MIRKNKNIYIRILEYGNDHPDGFSLFQIRDDLGLSEDMFKLINVESYGEGGSRVFLPAGKINKCKYGTEITKFILSFEGKFKLLEYKELEEARRSSLCATIFASLAIIISIAVGVIQINNIQEVYITNDKLKLDSPLKTEIINQPREQDVR
jgi:hypothetical protein